MEYLFKFFKKSLSPSLNSKERVFSEGLVIDEHGQVILPPQEEYNEKSVDEPLQETEHEYGQTIPDTIEEEGEKEGEKEKEGESDDSLAAAAVSSPEVKEEKTEDQGEAEPVEEPDVEPENNAPPQSVVVMPEWQENILFI